ncbi:MAG TPA: hypothetical protein VKW78_23155 [Terriglobales bacterium]|nr:hypothetical protein [Terriglobales bacterium]
MQPQAANNAVLTLSNVAALLGMVLGTAGFVISMMEYLRNRPKVKVTLKWDMTDTLTKEKMGIIKVTNVGRRPIFISIVALELPKGFNRYLVISDSIKGHKLSEGDAPAGFLVNYKDLQQYSRLWWKIRAYVEDSAANKYRSPELPKASKAPSWVVTGE